MNRSTVCFFKKGDMIGLAVKKKKIGAGKLNGWGGKYEEGENAVSCSIRELQEEAHTIVRPEGLEQVALIDFYLRGNLTFSCDVLFVTAWEGDPRETDEMGEIEWFHKDDLPLNRMMLGDKHWLPILLKGARIRGFLKYDPDFDSVSSFEHFPLRGA